MNLDSLESWLRESDPDRLRMLQGRADAARREHVGEAVHLRALVEISNYCSRGCTYCGLHAANHDVRRFRLCSSEVLKVARLAAADGFGTIVLQAGEDPAHDRSTVADMVRRIKGETGLAVTLSLGERDREDYRAWREAGADRYLLRFETGDVSLFRRLHPGPKEDGHPRLNRLAVLRELGYEIGGGVMVGLPGQSYRSLAEDLLRFAELDLDMIGLGPFIVHPNTPIARQPERFPHAEENQVPATARMALTALALARLQCPFTNLPATTALAVATGGYEDALLHGANVIMPDRTPAPYGQYYQIYPGKAERWEKSQSHDDHVAKALRNAGCVLGAGRGDSPAFRRRRTSEMDKETLS